MSPPWMPLYVADYLADTAHLRAAESGAYLHLIMHYWSKGGLPDDDYQLSAIARMTQQEWKKARATIKGFFFDGWRHARIDEELSKAHAKAERRAEAGKRGGFAKAEAAQNRSNARNLPEQNRSNALASSSQPRSATHCPSQEEELGGTVVGLVQGGRS